MVTKKGELNMKQKKTYQRPEAEVVKIDKEISLVMSSTPPGDPEDW
jgi:hypothetical protein